MPAPDSLGLTLHNNTKGLSEAAFRQKCGDGFVSAIRNGARRVIVFSYSMDQQDIEESLKISAEGKYGPAKGKASMERLRTQGSLKKETRITVFGKGGNSKPLPVDAEKALDYIENFGSITPEESAPLEVVVTPYSAIDDAHRRLLPGAAARGSSAQYFRFVDLYGLYASAAHSPSSFYHPFIPQEDLGIYADGIKRAAFCVSELLTICALDSRAGGRCETDLLLDLAKKEPSSLCRGIGMMEKTQLIDLLPHWYWAELRLITLSRTRQLQIQK